MTSYSSAAHSSPASQLDMMEAGYTTAPIVSSGTDEGSDSSGSQRDEPQLANGDEMVERSAASVSIATVSMNENRAGGSAMSVSTVVTASTNGNREEQIDQP